MLHECSCHFDEQNNVSCFRGLTCHFWNLFIARQLLNIQEPSVCTDSLSGAKEKPQTNPSPFSNLLLTRSSKAMWLLHAYNDHMGAAILTKSVGEWQQWMQICCGELQYMMSFYMFILKSPSSQYRFGKIPNLMRIHHEFKVWLMGLAYKWKESV